MTENDKTPVEMTENDKKPIEIAETTLTEHLKDFVESSQEYNKYIQKLAEYEKETVEAFKEELQIFNNTFVKKNLTKSIKDIQYKVVNPDLYVEQQIDKIVFSFKQNIDILKYNLKNIVKTNKPICKM